MDACANKLGVRIAAALNFHIVTLGCVCKQVACGVGVWCWSCGCWVVLGGAGGGGGGVWCWSCVVLVGGGGVAVAANLLCYVIVSDRGGHLMRLTPEFPLVACL